MTARCFTRTLIGMALLLGAVHSQSLSSISPTTVPMSSAVTLTGFGSGYGGCITPHLTGYLSVDGVVLGNTNCGANGFPLTVVVPAGMISSPATVPVRIAVYNSMTNLWTYSNTRFLTVTAAPPAIFSVLPASIPAGSATFNLTIFGGRLVSSHPFNTVTFNGVVVPFVVLDGSNGNWVIVSVPAPLIQSPGTAYVQVGHIGGYSNFGAFQITAFAPSITSLSPASIPVMTPSTLPVEICVSGSSFPPGSIVYANGVPLPTTYVSLYQVCASVTPSTPAVHREGGLAITVEASSTQVSNAVALRVGTGVNQGTIVTSPRVVPPGSGFNLRVEGGVVSAPLTLVVDMAAPTLVPNWPDQVTPMVLAVGVGNSHMVALKDGLGVLGPSDATAFGGTAIGTPPGGVFTMTGFIQPLTPVNPTLVVQGIYVDPSSQVGYRLTWARSP